MAQKTLIEYVKLKRSIDIVVSGLGLITVSPLLGVLAAVVAIKHGRPVLFTQARPGLNGHPFQLLKFRSMRTPDHGQGLISDEERLTPFGRWLRATSLDELPSLINVLRGDMSLIGPRPLLMQYLERYTERQAQRHNVRPGITGLAQSSGRNSLSWEEKFELDVQYVDSMSFRLDARILRMTVLTVLRRDGIAQEGQATVQEFMGSQSEIRPSENDTNV